MRRNTTTPDMRLELKYRSDLGEYIISDGRLTFRELTLRRGLTLHLSLLDTLISDLQRIKADLAEHPDLRLFERVEPQTTED